MTRDELRGLIGGYATGSLSEEERRILFEAALDDQELFDELAREQTLKSLLETPGAKGRLIAALTPDPPPAPWWSLRWVWAAAAAATLAVATGTLLLRPRAAAPVEVAQLESTKTPGSPNAPEVPQTPNAAPPEAANQPAKAPRDAASTTPSGQQGGRETVATQNSIRRDSEARQEAKAGGVPQVRIAPRVRAAPEADGGQQAPAEAVAVAPPPPLTAPAIGPAEVQLRSAPAPPRPGAAASAKAPPEGAVREQAPLLKTESGVVSGSVAPKELDSFSPLGGAEAGARAGLAGGFAGGGGGGRGGAPPSRLAAPRAVQAAAPRFAFDYSLSSQGSLRITPASDGFLSVVATGAGAPAQVLSNRPLRAGAAEEVQLPAGSTSAVVMYSAQQVTGGFVAATASGQTDLSSGTKVDANPSPQSRLIAVIPVPAAK